MLEVIKNSFNSYLEETSRSNKPTNILHKGIGEEIKKIFKEKYNIEYEYNIKCSNFSGKKNVI